MIGEPSVNRWCDAQTLPESIGQLRIGGHLNLKENPLKTLGVTLPASVFAGAGISGIEHLGHQAAAREVASGSGGQGGGGCACCALM